MRREIQWFVALTTLLSASALAQVAPPRPTPEQLDAAFKEDQLGDERCGIPRNAADDSVRLRRL